MIGGKSTEAFCLTLQGHQLNLSALLKEKKFRHRGHKEGALQAMRNLMQDDMGKLEESSVKGSVRVSIMYNNGQGSMDIRILNALE